MNCEHDKYCKEDTPHMIGPELTKKDHLHSAVSSVYKRQRIVGVGVGGGGGKHGNSDPTHTRRRSSMTL